MWWKLLIAFLLLQVLVGIFIGRFIKFGNPTTEQQMVWGKMARERVRRLVRLFKPSRHKD
jgi:hypothetical protein